MIEKVRQSVTTYIRRSIFITWFDQGGGVSCKYLTVRVDTTHWFIVSEAGVVSFIFLKSRRP